MIKDNFISYPLLSLRKLVNNQSSAYQCMEMFCTLDIAPAAIFSCICSFNREQIYDAFERNLN